MSVKCHLTVGIYQVSVSNPYVGLKVFARSSSSYWTPREPSSHRGKTRTSLYRDRPLQISLPVAILDWLSDNRVCSLISYVYSQNLLELHGGGKDRNLDPQQGFLSSPHITNTTYSMNPARRCSLIHKTIAHI